MLLTIKVEAQMDGRSALHFKDYREDELNINRVQAVTLVEKLEFVVTEFINSL